MTTHFYTWDPCRPRLSARMIKPSEARPSAIKGLDVIEVTEKGDDGYAILISEVGGADDSITLTLSTFVGLRGAVAIAEATLRLTRKVLQQTMEG